MSTSWKDKFKSKLKYHRIFVIVAVMVYIIVVYSQREDKNTYANGQVISNGETINGFNEGEWIWFYSSGRKKMQGYFKHGKREGKWTMWNSKGIIQNERTYSEDKLNGYYANYDEKGSKVVTGNYEKDRITSKEIIKQQR